MRRILCALAILCVMASGAWGNIIIDDNNFPDEAFRVIVRLDYDENNDNELSEAEIAKITSINKQFFTLADGTPLKSMEGVEYFTYLRTLNCVGNQIKTLDLSNNTDLEHLECWSNDLEELNIRGLSKLTFLDCSANFRLNRLDLSGCSNLKHIKCSICALEDINVSGLTELTFLDCSHNYLTGLNVNECTNLEELKCDGNHLTQLDVSGLQKLGSSGELAFSCSYNRLTHLNISGCPNLHVVSCDNNRLTELILDGCGGTGTLSLHCPNNFLTELNVSGVRLSSLNCSGNSLTALNLDGQDALNYLDCSNNLLLGLNLNSLSALRTLICEGNQLAALHIPNFPQITFPMNITNPSMKVSIDKQVVRELKVTQVKSDSSSPAYDNSALSTEERYRDMMLKNQITHYKLDFGDYMNSGSFFNITASSVIGYDEDNRPIISAYENGIAHFLTAPAKVKYVYRVNYISSSVGMNVTIGGSEARSLALNGHVYRAFNMKMTYKQAKAYCESLNGHLVTMTSPGEKEVVRELLQAIKSDPQFSGYTYWLGGESKDGEKWQWITSDDFTETVNVMRYVTVGIRVDFSDGSSLTTPNRVMDEELFLQISYEGELSGAGEAELAGFICEWEPVPADFPKYSQAYDDYIKNPAAYTSDENFYGMLPEARDISHLSGSPANVEIRQLPSKYDPRASGFMADVRDQGGYPSCWAFATLGALETNYNLQTSGNNAPDLSELHMIWYTYRDPRYTNGLSASQIASPLNAGGTVEKAVSLLSRAGTAAEEDFPYSILPKYNKDNDPDGTIIAGINRDVEKSVHGLPESYTHPIRLKEAHWLNSITEANRDEIKQLITDYGSVAVTYYHHKDGYKSNGDRGWSYYLPNAIDWGHVVMIVGWDDDYTASNFPAKGAWLAKNSWGSRSGEGGYFWMSYAQTIGHVAFFKAVGGEIASPYGHDTVAAVDSINYAWSANVFQARKAESLNEVSFQTEANNVSYEIYVNVFGTEYPGFPGNPGVPIKTGHLDYNGYQTITLDSPLKLEAGQWFSVILKLTPDSQDEYVTSVEDNTLRTSYDNSLNTGTDTFRAAGEGEITVAGKSFFSSKDIVLTSADWNDGQGLTTREGQLKTCNASIRIYSVSGSTFQPNPAPTQSPDTPSPDTPNPDTPSPDTPSSNNSGSGGGGCMTSSSLAGLAVMLLMFSKKYYR